MSLTASAPRPSSNTSVEPWASCRPESTCGAYPLGFSLYSRTLTRTHVPHAPAQPFYPSILSSVSFTVIPLPNGVTAITLAKCQADFHVCACGHGGCGNSSYDTVGDGYLREFDLENYIFELIPTLPNLRQLKVMSVPVSLYTDMRVRILVQTAVHVWDEAFALLGPR